jgi:hypothetical protein
MEQRIIMISLARVAARYPRAMVNELEEDHDGFILFEDAPGQWTAWRRNQSLSFPQTERSHDEAVTKDSQG